MFTDNVAAITPHTPPKPRKAKLKTGRPHVREELWEAIEELDKARSVVSILCYAVEESGDDDAYATLRVIVSQLHETRDILSKVSDRLYDEGAHPIAKGGAS